MHFSVLGDIRPFGCVARISSTELELIANGQRDLPRPAAIRCLRGPYFPVVASQNFFNFRTRQCPLELLIVKLALYERSEAFTDNCLQLRRSDDDVDRVIVNSSSGIYI